MQFHSLTIAEIRRETAEAVSLLLDMPPALAGQFHFAAGQYLTFCAQIGGEEVRRTYSLCVAPSAGEWRVAVKEITGGVFSRFVNRELRVGDVLQVAPPIGRFTWDFQAVPAGRYLAFAGGSGITPILSLISTALEKAPDCRFTLAYGNRDARSIMFLETLAALKDRYLDRLQVLHILDSEASEFAPFNGRLDRAKCDEILALLGDAAGLSAAFICGPGPMMDAAEAALIGQGLPSERILIERFTAGTPSAGAAAAVQSLAQQAEGTELIIIHEGRRRSLRFEAAKGSVLEHATIAGIAAPYACKGGVCGTCRARVISGRATMVQNYALTAEEVAQGYILTCQAVPIGDGVVVDYEG